VETTRPDTLATLLTPETVARRAVRGMFKDEARFGRMVRPKRGWAPAPRRPVLSSGHARECVAGYGAVSPLEGEVDWRLCREMTTLRMGEFLTQVGQAHPTAFSVMVVDGASSHTAKDLVNPADIRLLPLPPSALELNPQAHVWEELREKEFPNRVFDHLAAVIRQLEHGLPCLAADSARRRSLTAWPWIASLNLNAHSNKAANAAGAREGGTLKPLAQLAL
jgi:putative transposase